MIILAIAFVMSLTLPFMALSARTTTSAPGHDRRRSRQVTVHGASTSTADRTAQDPPFSRGHRLRVIAGDALSKAAGYGVFWLLKRAGEALLAAL